MPIPKRTQDRYAAEAKFPIGCRMVHKTTGQIYIRGTWKSVRDCWVMQLNPGRKYIVSGTQLLERFERAAI